MTIASVLVRNNQLSLTRSHRSGVCSHKHSTCSGCCSCTTGSEQPDAQLALLVALSPRMHFRGLIGAAIKRIQFAAAAADAVVTDIWIYSNSKYCTIRNEASTDAVPLIVCGAISLFILV